MPSSSETGEQQIQASTAASSEATDAQTAAREHVLTPTDAGHQAFLEHCHIG